MMIRRHVDPTVDPELLLGELEVLQSRLEKVQDALAQTQKLATLGTMAAAIAHEFNNLMTPLIGSCQLSEREPDDPTLARKAVQRSLAAAQKATAVSRLLLGFVREGGAGERRASVDSAVRDALGCLVRPPARDGIAVELEIDPALEAAIDPSALQQILLNLFLNACRAMQGRRGRLRISTSEEAGRVRIDVADTGPGIPDSVSARLFEPFARGAGEAGEGTGLGLAICRDLLQRAGGRIDLKSSGPEGAVFRIEVPRA